MKAYCYSSYYCFKYYYDYESIKSIKDIKTVIDKYKMFKLRIYLKDIDPLELNLLNEFIINMNYLTTLKIYSCTYNNRNIEFLNNLKEILLNKETITDLQLYDINKNEKLKTNFLYDALTVNTTLQKLTLDNYYYNYKDVNNFNNEILKLSEILLTNNTLTELHLTSCYNLYRIDKSPLFEALKYNKSITKLNLHCGFSFEYSSSKVNIYPNQFKVLSEMLIINTNLTHLNLNYNCIGDEGLQHISEALLVNTSLTQLYLWKNYFSDVGIKSLCNALKANSTLTKLQLGLNKFNDSSVYYLCNMLKNNSVLTTLNLNHISIDMKSVELICEALKTNTTLTHLNLLQNRIKRSDDKNILMKSLQYNSTLTKLKI